MTLEKKLTKYFIITQNNNKSTGVGVDNDVFRAFSRSLDEWAPAFQPDLTLPLCTDKTGHLSHLTAFFHLFLDCTSSPGRLVKLLTAWAIISCYNVARVQKTTVGGEDGDESSGTTILTQQGLSRRSQLQHSLSHLWADYRWKYRSTDRALTRYTNG